MLLVGTGAGALSVIDGLDLRGTTWIAAVFHLVVFGAGGLGALGGLWWWAPKFYGRRLSDGAGALAFAAVFLGTLAIAIADLVNGLSQDVVLVPGASTDAGYVGLNVLAVAGSVLLVVGVLVALGALVLAGIGRTAGATDPWGGATLEWATASPPVRANFAEPIGVVRSATPLLDEREA
jgi:cytochrome c oxidase subunit 1